MLWDFPGMRAPVRVCSSRVLTIEFQRALCIVLQMFLMDACAQGAMYSIIMMYARASRFDSGSFMFCRVRCSLLSCLVCLRLGAVACVNLVFVHIGALMRRVDTDGAVQ